MPVHFMRARNKVKETIYCSSCFMTYFQERPDDAWSIHMTACFWIYLNATCSILYYNIAKEHLQCEVNFTDPFYLLSDQDQVLVHPACEPWLQFLMGALFLLKESASATSRSRSPLPQTGVLGILTITEDYPSMMQHLQSLFNQGIVQVSLSVVNQYVDQLQFIKPLTKYSGHQAYGSYDHVPKLVFYSPSMQILFLEKRRLRKMVQSTYSYLQHNHLVLKLMAWIPQTKDGADIPLSVQIQSLWKIFAPLFTVSFIMFIVKYLASPLSLFPSFSGSGCPKAFFCEYIQNGAFMIQTISLEKQVCLLSLSLSLSLSLN